MHVYVVRNHRRCHIDASLARHIEVAGSKLHHHAIALNTMAPVIHFQLWGLPFDAFNFHAINDSASHKGLFRPFVSFPGDLEGFYRTEFTLVASHKMAGLPRIFKQSKKLAKVRLRHLNLPSRVRVAHGEPSDCPKFLPLSKRGGDTQTWRKILKEQGEKPSLSRFPDLLDRIRRQQKGSAHCVFERLFPRQRPRNTGKPNDTGDGC